MNCASRTMRLLVKVRRGGSESTNHRDPGLQGAGALPAAPAAGHSRPWPFAVSAPHAPLTLQDWARDARGRAVPVAGSTTKLARVRRGEAERSWPSSAVAAGGC